MSTAGESKLLCEMALEFPSEEHALSVFRAVETDNEGYVHAELNGSTLTTRIEASSLKSLLHTLDDFLACVSVADKVVRADVSLTPPPA
ncbi:MAG: hypothetical protein JSV90_08105 [Methanobacteriota archaeon]|nr:MAG: hypothetical protein JSV90_08105 [Euryarchaeota archaeon]